MASSSGIDDGIVSDAASTVARLQSQLADARQDLEDNLAAAGRPPPSPAILHFADMLPS